MSVRAVVVGYGRAGRKFHGHLIGLTPGLELRGYVSSDPDKRQAIAEEGLRPYAGLDEAITDPEVDLVVLATPNHTHADLAIQALRAGKHVVTDKPFALNLAQCDAMIAAAEASGVFLSAFQNRRFDGDWLTVRKLLDAGELGDVRWVEMAWQGFGPWGGWRGQQAFGGGRYLDLGAHLVDQLCLLFPQPVETVYGRMVWDWDTFDVESEALIIVTFEGGATGVCDFSGRTAISKPRFHLKGSAATFVKYGLDPQEAAMMAGDIDAATEDPRHYGVVHDGRTERPVPTLPGRWRSYYENVADVLLHGAEPAVKLPEVRRAISVLEAGRQSAETGEVVRPET